MLIKVLGSAAGSGLPQWNCNCRNCIDARNVTSDIKARKQSSIAVSANERDFVLLNASPDLRQSTTHLSFTQTLEGPLVTALSNQWC